MFPEKVSPLIDENESTLGKPSQSDFLAVGAFPFWRKLLCLFAAETAMASCTVT